MNILWIDSGDVNMSVFFPVSQSSINAVVVKGRTQLLLSSNICSLGSRGISSSFSSSCFPGQLETNHVGLFMGQTIRGGYLGSCYSKQRGTARFFSSVVPQKRHNEISLACQSMSMRLLVPKQKMLSKVKCNVGPRTWSRVGLIFGLFVCNLGSEPAHAEADYENENRKDDCDDSNAKFSHGKKVYTDYSVIGELQNPAKSLRYIHIIHSVFTRLFTHALTCENWHDKNLGICINLLHCL